MSLFQNFIIVGWGIVGIIGIVFSIIVYKICIRDAGKI